MWAWPLDAAVDRFMICGSPTMLKICELLDSRGLRESRHGEAAHYVIERAFVGELRKAGRGRTGPLCGGTTDKRVA